MKSQDNPPFQILTQETGGFGTEEDICKEVSCLGFHAKSQSYLEKDLA